MTESSPHNLDERISAYLDGELSEEETRVVQQELEESAAARDLLRQYKDLRQMLREIPAEDLPDELQTGLSRNVLSRVESAKPSVTPSRKHYWKVILPLLASAAGVMLLVRFNPPRQEQVAPSVEFENRHPGGADGLGTQESAEVADEESASELGALREDAPQSMAKTSPDPASPEAEAPLDSGGQMSVTNRISADRTERPVAKDVSLGKPERLVYDKSKTSTIVSTDGKRSYEMTPEQLESLKIGETVRALQHSGDEVSVVDLFVVDQEKALDSLQLILSSQKVPKEGVEENRGLALKKNVAGELDGDTPSLKEKEKQESLTEDPYSLVAVYVEASESQLTATLEELKREHQQFVELAIQEPVQTEELSRALEEETVAENKRDQYFSNKPGENSGLLSKFLKRESNSALPQAEGEPGGFGGGGGGFVGGGGFDSKNLPHVPRQQALQVSPEVLNSLARSRRAPTEVDRARSTLNDAVTPSITAAEPSKPLAQKKADAAPTEEQLTRQMQVLFVLKQRPQEIHKARIAPPARSETPRIK